MNECVKCNSNYGGVCTCREDETMGTDECPYYSPSYCEARDCCECEYKED